MEQEIYDKIKKLMKDYPENDFLDTMNYILAEKILEKLKKKGTIPIQRVKEVINIKPLMETHYPKTSDESPHDYCQRIKETERQRIFEELGLE